MIEVINLLAALSQLSILIFFVVCSVYYTVKHLTFVLPLRRLRAENIAKHGWPPPHLDADGDWRPEPKRDDDIEEDE